MRVLKCRRNQLVISTICPTCSNNGSPRLLRSRPGFVFLLLKRTLVGGSFRKRLREPRTLPALARLSLSDPHSLLNDALLGEKLPEFTLSGEKAAVNLMAGLIAFV